MATTETLAGSELRLSEKLLLPSRFSPEELLLGDLNTLNQLSKRLTRFPQIEEEIAADINGLTLDNNGPIISLKIPVPEDPQDKYRVMNLGPHRFLGLGVDLKTKEWVASFQDPAGTRPLFSIAISALALQD